LPEDPILFGEALRTSTEAKASDLHSKLITLLHGV
jgi:hypothetical protein